MYNVQELSEIIKLIDQSSIEEFTYESDGASVTLKKSGSVSKDHPPALQPVKETVPVDAQQNAQAEVKAAPVEEKLSENETNYDYEIVSPMVGTFYVASSPDNDPFVSVGSKVDTNSVVCIVEAMKLFNEIEAEVTGEIVEIMAENGELVEYGQPLFRVKTN